MKRVQVSTNKEQWPNQQVKSIECRKRDLIVRIADWTRQSLQTGEPGYDVEVYIGGVYSWGESKSFTLSSGLTKKQAKQRATEYASAQIAKLL